MTFSTPRRTRSTGWYSTPWMRISIIYSWTRGTARIIY
jgi:hypothetical protein